MRFFFTNVPHRPRLARAARIFAGLLVGFGGAVLTGRPAGQPAEAVRFDLPADTATMALRKFSEQSGRSVVVPAELVQGVRFPAVAGEMTPAAALVALLAGAPLAAVEDPTSGAFAIVRHAAPAAARTRWNAQAVIIVGLAAGDEQEARFWEQAAAARAAFAARGIPPESIQLLPAKRGAPIRAEMILGALRAAKPGVDETWVFLLGNVAPGRDGQPMFQVNGPRLAADDVAAAVAALPGRRYVVVAAARSGGFLPPLLKVANVEAVAATAAAGELNEPRFAGMWVERLQAEPGASFQQLAAVTAAEVAAFYRENKLVQTEHAQVIDRAGDRIVALEP